MPTTIPIAGAGEFTLTETRVNIYSSLGMLRVRSIPDYAFESFGAAEVSGERLDPSHEAWETKGIVTIPATAALDAGELPDSLSLGSLEEGFFAHDPALGSEEVSGELDKPAFGLLGIGAPGGFSGTTEYGSLGTAGITTDRKDPALAAADVAGQGASAAPIGLLVRTDRNTPAHGTLEAGEFGRSKPALSSLETAQFIEETISGALEVQDGDSVDFVVDIQDEILASGHGDC
jgi:hypothetical protein